MKTHVLIAGLLVMSIVATGFVLAQSDNVEYARPTAVKAMRVQAINAEGVAVPRSLDTQEASVQAGFDDVTMVDAIYDELDKDVGERKASGFGRAWIGHGYVIFDGENDYGKLARIVWVRKEVVADMKSASNSESTVVYSESLIARGILQLRDAYSSESYKMVLDQNSDFSENSWNFAVMKGNERVGTLKLEQATSVEGIVVWEGRLTLNNVEGAMTFATTTSSVRKAPVASEDKPETNMPYPKENRVETLCSEYAAESEEYAKCKENAYQQYGEAQSEGTNKWTWEEFFSRLFKSDKKSASANN